jgi:hypothetical protein
MGQPLRPLLNLRDKIPGLATCLKLLGLSTKRTLPRWQTRTFSTPAPLDRVEVLAAAKRQVLFVDTFNDRFEV